jgi:hypothetical protein
MRLLESDLAISVPGPGVAVGSADDVLLAQRARLAAALPSTHRRCPRIIGAATTVTTTAIAQAAANA